MNLLWAIIIIASSVIAGSIRLVSDAIYVVLQIPVMLIYLSFLKLQLPQTIPPLSEKSQFH